MGKLEERKERIKLAAKTLFIEQGIEQTTFVQIATKADVGEATVYRHFGNKGGLALEIAIDYAQAYASFFLENPHWSKMNHYDRFETVLNHYIDLYQDQPDYFIYLEHFDNYISREGKSQRFNDYEEAYTSVFEALYHETVDHSAIDNERLVKLAYTFNISFLSLCQKLLLRGHVLSNDDRYIDDDNLSMMRDVMMKSLKEMS